jgi:hypothetical protein
MGHEKKTAMQVLLSASTKLPAKATAISVCCERVPIEMLRKYSSSKPLASRAKTGK